MIRMLAFVWPDHAWVLAEEVPGVLQRLVGDPWDSDGALPLLLTRLGREAYIGTLAECVNYESPRAEMTRVLGAAPSVEAADLAARFVRLLDETVRRRFPQDELAWRFLLAPTVPQAAHGTLSAACWLAGLAQARIDALPALPMPPAVLHGLDKAADAQATRVLAHLDGDAQVATLACQRGNGLLAIDSTRDERQDRVAYAEDLSVTSPRGDLHRTWWQRRMHCEEGALPDRVAMPQRGGWSLQDLPESEVRDHEAARWTALAALVEQPFWPTAGGGASAPIVIEWGQRHWAKRFATSGQKAFPRGATRCPLEAVAVQLQDRPATLDRTIALALESGRSATADHKVVASRGAALPLRSEHLLSLSRIGQRLLPFELRTLDEQTGSAYRVAAGDIALPAESRHRMAVQLAVTCHPCGALELDFDIPAWHFKHTVLVDAAAGMHADARFRARALQTGS